MEGSKDRSAKRTIRATKAQTVILQDAFTQSNIASPEELKTLSEKTGLPEKWIYLWFGRQRVKARKINIGPGPLTSSSDLVPSLQETIEVKTEYRGSLVPMSSSPAVLVAIDIGPTSNGNVTQSEKAPPKKKTRVRAPRANKKQRIVQNNIIKNEYLDPVVGALGTSASQPPSMAQDFISCSISHPPRLNESPFVTLPALPFRRIAPPSRTPLTSANILAHPHPGEDRQSGLSTNQSYRIYPTLRASEVSVNVQPSPDVFKSSRAAVYQQGPMFRAHFYNNGPVNYQDTRSNLEAVPKSRSDNIPVHNPGLYLAEPLFPHSDGSERQNPPKQVGLDEYFSQSLAPAIVLENTSKPMPSVVPRMNDYSDYPSSSSVQYIGRQNLPKQVSPGEFFSQSLAPATVLENTTPLAVPPFNSYSAYYPSSSSMQYIGPRTFSEGLLYPPNYSVRPNCEESVNANTEDLDISAGCNLFISRMEAPRSFPTFYNEALDPSLAPLKHLTDVLERFREQDGTYTKLVDLQEREGLMKCLLDDELARRSPFQAAMGLVLLSKLGLEWDY